MGYNLSQNFISGQPPLLLFTVCLTAFGLTMIVLAYVIGDQDIPNPDVLVDWNKFFKQISTFKMCPIQNSKKAVKDKTVLESIYTTDTILNISSHVVDQSRSLSAALSNVVHHSSEEMSRTLNTEIFAKVQFKLIGKAQPVSFFQVNARVKGSLLGFSGKYGVHLFNISLNFLSPGNSSCTADGNCESVWNVCVVIGMPVDLLSEAKSPERCDNRIVPSSNFVQPFFLDIQDSYKNYLSSECIGLDYSSNPKLTEMLSLHDHSIINLHLMHTSYFMFVMVMTLICYSLIKGRYRMPKNSHSLEKGLLDT